jgi:hypothetical protein
VWCSGSSSCPPSAVSDTTMLELRGPAHIGQTPPPHVRGDLPGAGGPLRARDGRAPGERARRSRRIAAARLVWTTSIRAAKPLLARHLHRQSMGALTGRAAFPSHGLRSRNRLEAAAPRRPPGPLLVPRGDSGRQLSRAVPGAAGDRPTRRRGTGEGEPPGSAAFVEIERPTRDLGVGGLPGSPMVADGV